VTPVAAAGDTSGGGADAIQGGEKKEVDGDDLSMGKTNR
jgi:hypothetical protein